MPDAPNNERILVSRSDPHAAHPIPITPLVIPNSPVATPACFVSSTLRRKKKTIIDRFVPNKTAMAIVKEAESSVKFVAIDPKRLIGKSSFCEKDAPGCPITPTMSGRFGSQTANANIAALIARARNVYCGFRNTFCKA